MKRKFFATLAMFILVLAGAFSPVLSLVTTQMETKIAYAGLTDSGTTTSVAAEDASDLKCGFNVLCGAVTGYVALVQLVPHFFAEMSGILLDWTVWKNLQSSTWTDQDKVDSFVVKGWKIMRDFSNLLFIFALFVVAFSLILNGAGTGERPLFGLDPKRTIARVILMALLINFSFFMCRVIIDMTNTFGNLFYTKISKVIDPKSSDVNQSTTATKHSTIDMGKSGPFYANKTGIRSVSLGILTNINPQTLITTNGQIVGEEHSAAGGLVSWFEYDMGVYVLLLFVSTLVAIFNFFLIYLFVSSSIFLISRIYGLYFLIILSPIAFVSTTIPQLQNKEYFGFDDWFKQLTGLAFCLPIYLFFMYLAVQFVTAGEPILAKSGYIAMGVGILTRLAMMGAVLILGKKVAKDLSGKIGAMATNAVTGVVTGAAMIAGAAMTGGASAALRMGGSMAKNAATNVAGSVVGNDNVESIRQRFGSGNYKNLSRFNNFNPLKDMGGKTMGQRVGQLGKNLVDGQKEAMNIGFDLAGNKRGEIAGALRQGKLTPRAENIAAIRKEKDEKVKAIDSKITSIDNQLKNPNLSQTERAELNRQKKDLQKEKWNVQNPPIPGQAQALPPANGTATPAAPGATAQPTTQPTKTTAGTTGNTGAAATLAPKMATAVPNGKEDTPKSSLTPEQTKQVITEIENEMRAVEKEMNEPATRLNKNRMQELEGKYNNLDSERKGVNSGTVLPARLKSFAGNPISDGAPKKTFGEGNTDGSWKTDLNLTQQDRVLRKAVEKQDRMQQKATAISKNSSRTASLLSGISTGAPIVPEPNHDDFDQSGMIETPGGMDFGGMQIPEADHGDMTPIPQAYHTEAANPVVSALANAPLGTTSGGINPSGQELKIPTVKETANELATLNKPENKIVLSVGEKLGVVPPGVTKLGEIGEQASKIISVNEQKLSSGLLDQYGTPNSKPNTTNQSNIITSGPTPNPNAQIKSANDFKKDDASSRPPLIL